MTENIKEQIIDIIDTIRLYIQQDGGDLEFVDFYDNIVVIKLLGACVGCSNIDTTYKDGVEAILRDETGLDIIVKLIE